MFAVVHLYRENTALRKDAMDLLKKYQERDEEDRRFRIEEERRRDRVAEELRRVQEGGR